MDCNISRHGTSFHSHLMLLCCSQVLAMARPWQENLVAHKLPEALQAAGVGMILNLQVALHAASFSKLMGNFTVLTCVR